MVDLGQLGYVAALGLAATGSALGCGIAGQAAIGVWKKGFLAGKGANSLMLAFAGAPLTQTIYGMILMNAIKVALDAGINSPALFGIGIFGGLGIGASAWYQGKCAAAAADAQGETGKGFAQYMIVVGIVETVALFVMAFAMGQIPTAV